MNGGTRKPSGEKGALFKRNRSILTPMGANRRFNVIEPLRVPRRIPPTVSGGYLSDPSRRIKTAHHLSSQHRQVASSEWRVEEHRKEENKTNRGGDGRIALRVP